MSLTKITLAMMVCTSTGIMFTHRFQQESTRYAMPGMINANPVVSHEIEEATGNAEELIFIYERKCSRANTPQAREEAEAFYDKEVVPAQVTQLKTISQKHCFRYQGLPIPSRIHHKGRQASLSSR